MRTQAISCLFALGALAAFVSCRPVTTQRQSNLLDYLSSKEAPPAQAEKASLQFPLRLGVVFIPGGASKSTDRMMDQESGQVLITQEQEAKLTNILQEHLAGKPWIADCKVVPSTYLSKGGGFQDLEKTAHMYGLDIMMLVSVNQVQFTNPKWYSWTYVTGVGAYTIKGEKNDTSTFVDGAVFHVPTRTLLFRAGGENTLKGSSTIIQRGEQLRQNSLDGLTLAVRDLCTKLDTASGAFQSEVNGGRRKDVQFLAQSK
jgi:rhombotail lipoprotein